MSKKVISVILILAIITALVITLDPFGSKQTTEASQYRNLMRIVPEKQDTAGISPDTSFLLNIEEEKLKEIDFDQDPVYITGEDKPLLEKLSDGSFRITPVKNLDEGKVYIIGVRTTDGEETTWAFQTSFGLKIVSSFPADMGTYVPVNSGIEIYFNQPGFENYAQSFSIEPKVEGEFEVHKNVLVFVPNGLEPNTVYTVTISAGINLTGSDVSLQSDHSFSFATTPEDETEEKERDKGYFAFSRDLTEYSSKEGILIPVYYYMRNSNRESTFKVDTKIYAFSDIKEFKKAYEESSNAPYWARGQVKPDVFDTSGVDLVLEKTFELPAVQRNQDDGYLDFGNDLPKGYYVVQAEYEGTVSQTFIQVTDLLVFVMNTNTGYFIWAKDLDTKNNAAGAVIEFDTGERYTTGDDGIINDRLNNDADSAMAVMFFEDEALIINLYEYDYQRQWYNNSSYRYWNVFQTDRNLYKSDDIISYFGFIKPRDKDTVNLNELTLELTRGGYMPYFSSYVDYGFRSGFYFPGMGEPLLREKISVDSYFFEGALELPSLAPGRYNLRIKDNGTVISSVYITIEEYTKPAYKIELEKSKKVIFYGDEIEFEFKSMFFEGTPVANLDFRIDVGTHFGSDQKTIEAVTDTTGRYKVSYVPSSAREDTQGMQYAYISAISSIPEMGEISVNDYFYVFINDIWAVYDARISDGTGKLDIEVNYVDLTRLNEDPAVYDFSDHKGAAVSGRQIKGTIQRIEYVKVITGDYYDYINKVRRNTYSYERVITPVKGFTINTNSLGKASVEFIPDDTDSHVYYTAEFSMIDSNGRTIKNTAYFYNNRYSTGYYDYYDDYTRIEIEGENKHQIGDIVNAKYIHLGNEVTEGEYAYILLQNGIRDYALVNSSKYSFAFTEEMMPNMYLGGVYFTGRLFEFSQAYIGFDYSTRDISIKAELDKKSYRPGDTVRINIEALDKNNEPIRALVNAAIVDEALFALGEQYVDTLLSLFSDIGNGLKYKYTTHSLDQYFYGPVVYRGAELKGEVEDMALEQAPVMSKNTQDEGTVIRSEFKDTAFYGSVMLDDNGKGVLEFLLPHNITSWRVTLQAVSDEIKAGSDKVSLDVSLPMFVNYSLSDVLLTGDRPYIGISVYGSALLPDDIIDITVSNEDGIIAGFPIAAFERKYVSLPAFTQPGEYELMIKAAAKDGLEDIIIHKYRVIASFYETDTVLTQKAKASMTLPKGDYGITTYSFTDSSSGKYAPVLYSLAYQGGNRIEQKVVSDIAKELILEYFDQDHKSNPGYSVLDYQKADGGIAFLPYGSSDIFTTVMMIPYIKDSIDIQALKMYLYNVLDAPNQPNSKAAAYYGLAILNEPVLLQIQEYEKVKNLDTVDMIYIALAYTQFREITEARRLYSEYIADKVNMTETNARLEFGSTPDEKLKNTALLAMLASKAELPEKNALYNYITKEYSKEYLTIIEKLEFIRTELKKSKPLEAEVVYEYLGERKTLVPGPYQSSVSVISKLADQFKIVSVKGDIDVHAVYKTNKTLTGSGSGISISRQYTNYTRPGEAFSKNDIIKVTLNISISKGALAKDFEITDYLPSGLRAIDAFGKNDYYMHRNYYINIEGQKVFFSVFGHNDKDTVLTVSYLARVVNPGEYKAEKPVMRGYTDKSLIAVGQDQMIDISDE